MACRWPLGRLHCASSRLKHAGKLDRPGRHGRRAAWGRAVLSTATRCSCWSPANGQAPAGHARLSRARDAYGAAAAATGLHAPAALAIAVHALCLALFERVALGQAHNQDRLLTVDDATLTLGSHALTPYAVPRRDWQPPGTPLSAAQCGAGLRQDLGGSLLPDAGVAELNAIARSVQALTDERTGPLARADDGDLFQLPLASCLAHAGAGSRVLMLGLSARETRNHAALWALEQRLAHNGPAHAGAHAASAGTAARRCCAPAAACLNTRRAHRTRTRRRARWPTCLGQRRAGLPGRTARRRRTGTLGTQRLRLVRGQPSGHAAGRAGRSFRRGHPARTGAGRSVHQAGLCALLRQRRLRRGRGGAGAPGPGRRRARNALAAAMA
ncbi:hypothetical protein LP419_15490 [Massilia sp. H-1]|nr:hypothetical protein LP419_15490 [Massilia sp. H-1]